MTRIPHRAILRLRQRLVATRGSEGGQVLVLAVLFMTVLLGGAGMAIDAGMATIARRSAQAAADAAALAGASDLTGQAVNPTPGQTAAAIADATSEATTNGFTTGSKSTTVTVASAPTTSSAHNGDVHSVEVTITRQVPTFLLGVIGKTSITVTGHAVATGFGSYTSNPTMALLNPALPESLDVGITGAASSAVNLTVDGPLVVNSNDGHEAEQVHNNYFFNAPTNIVRGRIDQLGNGTIGPSSQVLNNPIPDPLASVPIPSSTNDPQWNVLGTGYKCPPGTMPIGNNNCSNGGTSIPCNSAGPPQATCNVNHYNEVVNPGVWYDLELTDDGSITMNPGTYIITGYLQLIDGPDGPGKITANGVTLYFACPSNNPPYWQSCTPGTGNQNGSGPGGYLNLTGADVSTTNGWNPDSTPHTLRGTYTLTAPTSGSYKGLTIFYDRQNYNPNFGATEDHPTGIEIEGGSADVLSGTIYGQHTRGIFYTPVTGSPWTINSCFILDTLEIDGLSDYHITCGQGGNYYSSAGAGSATLTE